MPFLPTLRPLVALAALTLATPLLAQETPASAPQPEAGVAAESTPVAAPETAPAAAPSAAPLAIAVKSGYVEDMASYNKVVVVPTAYVKLLVEGSVFAAKQASAFSTLGGGSGNSVKAKAAYTVAGIDKAFAQGLAKQAYDDFVAKLRGAGYTVLTYDDVKGRDYVAGASRDTGDATWGLPTEKVIGSRDTYVVAAPSDEMAFKVGFTGPFSEFVSMGKPRFKDAAVVIPVYTINAPLASTETGSGFNRIEASASVSPAMNLQAASAMWMGAPKVRMGGGMMPGVMTREPVLNVVDSAGTLSKEDTTSKGANALSKTLSLFGGGSVSSSSANYTYTIDRAAYAGGVLRAATSFNTEVAKALGTP